MASQKINCFYDTYVRDGSDDTEYESSEYLQVGPNTTGIIQFNLPAIEEINIVSAKLFFYIYTMGGNIEIIPKLFDWDEPLSGLTYRKFKSLLSNKVILEGDDVLVCSGTANLVNRWESLDITNLIIGHLGEPYYTIGMYGSRIQSGQNTYGTVLRTIESGFPMYIQLEYTYSPPFKPTIISPNGDAVDNSGTLRFQWKYNSSGSSGQQKFDLWWKMQSDASWKQISQTTPNTYYDMDASQFTNGIVEWQVRTYNNKNMVSDWATAQFVVIGKPANPVITGVRNDAITEITWQATKTEEAAARIKILQNGKQIYDSGIIPAGISDSYKPNIILANGRYTALLSISNMYGMWSNEVSYSFDISNAAPASPKLDVSGNEDHVILQFSSATDGCSYIIYRSENDGEFVPIDMVTEKFYKDYYVKPEVRYQYFIRAYKKSYSDSERKDVVVKYKGFYLSEVTSMGKRVNFFFHDSEEYIPIQAGLSNNNVLVSYYGRKKPVKETGVFEFRSVSIEAYLERETYITLMELFRENGIYCFRGKDMLIYCDITEFSNQNAFFNAGQRVSLTFEEVDYDQVVEFDEIS